MGMVWQKTVVLERGHKYLISADSGKGKSTFLNIIYGIRKDYSGKVFFDTTEIQTLNANVFSVYRNQNLSYLFQDLRLFGNITARENINLKPGNKFTNGEIDFYAEKLGIESLLNRPCQKLSLGQQQRIAMLRALSQPFQWLLLDEPFSHLDNKNAKLMMELILQRTGEEKAGIIATSLGETKGFDEFKVLDL